MAIGHVQMINDSYYVESKIIMLFKISLPFMTFDACSFRETKDRLLAG